MKKNVVIKLILSVVLVVIGISFITYGIYELRHYTKEGAIIEVNQEEELVYVVDNDGHLWTYYSDCAEEVEEDVVVMTMKRKPKEEQFNDEIVNVKIVKD